MELSLSKKQMSKIEYECNLLRITIQQLYVVAPHLFHEGVTAANTVVSEVNQFEELKEKAKGVLQSFDSEEFHSFY
jgi:hypothetical protein